MGLNFNGLQKLILLGIYASNDNSAAKDDFSAPLTVTTQPRPRPPAKLTLTLSPPALTPTTSSPGEPEETKD
jgi:hypothetical protein